MSIGIDIRDEAGSFVDKWRARWPEWELGMVFVPAPQRPLAEAWMALLNELGEAAWGGADPTPGLAKLAWWQEELVGWSKGARRHPLGALLQPQAAPWQELGRALPDLRALRGDEGGDARHDSAAGQAFATAVAGCEAALFAGREVDPDASAAVLASLLGERELMRAASMDAIERVDDPSVAARPGTRQRGIQAALVAARLGRPGKPPSPLRSLFAAWRGARSAA